MLTISDTLRLRPYDGSTILRWPGIRIQNWSIW